MFNEIFLRSFRPSYAHYQFFCIGIHSYTVESHSIKLCQLIKSESWKIAFHQKIDFFKLKFNKELINIHHTLLILLLTQHLKSLKNVYLYSCIKRKNIILDTCIIHVSIYYL